ncbi:MAG: DUF4345 family protein [Halioglobus sp.]
MLGKFILLLSALVFTVYGLVCLYAPEVAAGYAGLEMTNGDAYAEIGAMYGGLQTGVGLFCLMGLLQPQHTRSALTLLAMVIGLLTFGRLYSALTAEDAVTTYTWGALGYEFFTAVTATIALRQLK